MLTITRVDRVAHKYKKNQKKIGDHQWYSLWTEAVMEIDYFEVDYNSQHMYKKWEHFWWKWICKVANDSYLLQNLLAYAYSQTVLFICLRFKFNLMVYFECWYMETEKATDVSQASEDWALYMEICDVINSTEEGYVTYFIMMCVTVSDDIV